MTKERVIVGKVTAADIRRDFLEAIQRAEAGDLTPEVRLQFESFEALKQALASKRRDADS